MFENGLPQIEFSFLLGRLDDRGSLSGCCGGNVAHPAMELGKPRRGPENYQPLNVAGVNVHLDKEVASFSGTAEISLDKALWWNTLSLNYREE